MLFSNKGLCFSTGVVIRVILLLPSFFLTKLTIAQPVFLDVAESVGVDHLHYNRSIANGVSFMDFDGDGDDDLTLASEKGQPIDFYLNMGGVFEKITPLVDNLDEVTQILWIDIDNDGDKDFFVTAKNGMLRLYENKGGLILEDITEAAGLSLPERTIFGATWGDYDRDGLLDLYFGDHNSNDPTTFENRMFRNNGDNTFSEITYGSHSEDSGKFMWCSTFLDFNNDMWPDIYNANDQLTYTDVTNTMLINNGDCTFSDASVSTGTNRNMHNMGIAVGDYDNDGWQDFYLTNTAYAGNSLFHSLGTDSISGNIRFEDIAQQTGTIFNTVSWSANFLDADNDGFLDLYVNSSTLGSKNLFCMNNGDGTFHTPMNSFEADTLPSYSNAIGDFNNDGFPDIVVQNDAPFRTQLWSNNKTQNRWLKVGLTGVKSNRDAIGAKIEIYFDSRYQMRYVHSAIGFLGQNSNSEIFGLGLSENIDSLTVSWPTGHIDSFYNISTNQKISIVEGESTNNEIFTDPAIGLNCNSLIDPPRDAETPIDPDPDTPPIEIILGISDQLDNGVISVSPNPFNRLLMVNTGSTSVDKLIISDIGGRIIKTVEVKGNLINIDLSTLANEVYILELQGKNIANQRVRLLKQ